MRVSFSLSSVHSSASIVAEKTHSRLIREKYSSPLVQGPIDVFASKLQAGLPMRCGQLWARSSSTWCDFLFLQSSSNRRDAHGSSTSCPELLLQLHSIREPIPQRSRHDESVVSLRGAATSTRTMSPDVATGLQEPLVHPSNRKSAQIQLPCDFTLSHS